MSSTHLLSIRCGPRALAAVRQGGLQPQDVELIPAAAGGPKGLALHGLDWVLFGEWLRRAPSATGRRHLVGASIGAWRMAAGAMADPLAGLARLADLYCEQRYPAKPSRQFVTTTCEKMLADFVGDHDSEILAHPDYRLSVLSVRGKRLLAQAGPRNATAGFAAAALANALSRDRLRHWLERAWFYDSRDKPPLLPLDDFHTHEIALTATNLRPALLASGAIPLVLDAVVDLDGAPQGNYWDGGLIDYHLNLPYNRITGLVLYPHFIDSIVPGWLDKSFPWRKASGPWLDNMVLVSPSKAFVAGLPGGKLPDRKDFRRYGPAGTDERIRVWRQAIGESMRLGEEFLRLVDTGEIAVRAQPL